MNYFKKWNDPVGWMVFAVALVCYVLTTEPTASWWDCMEFTATSYKLEVGHPPGAPLFMMIMRLFTMLSFGNTAWVGFAANLMSCVASAFCILFMFWTITRLARKMYGAEGFDASDKTQVWTTLGAGITGSLAYAFTDSFWFSAVESEVYALSSMFTALVVWLMLRWDEVADQPHSGRWLVLIAYMMGLSIGVHILNLLAIPALVLIFYFRKAKQITWRGALVALVASGAILGVIYKMIMPWTVSAGAWFDRMFVNGFGLPTNSGMIFWVLVLLALVALGVWFSHKHGRVVWNTVLLCLGVILIGYTSYAAIVIRSSVDPPMNSNRPDNPYALQTLMSRSQYESQPIFYGQMYSTARMIDQVKYSPGFRIDENGKYEYAPVWTGYEYAPQAKVLFPRMWNDLSARNYEAWMGEMKMRSVRYGGETVKVPTLGENIEFFFTYQLNFMYWRYFMWNFVGRQDDTQGRGDVIHGNWLSGIEPIDALYLGPQTDLPQEVARNKARNKFYFLPFLLGLLGFITQLSKDKRGFVVVLSLFVMMGVALVVYFNIAVHPPRERDYIYAGSFYAFAIWIGFGVVWIQELVTKLLKNPRGAISAAVATVVCACVPLVLAAEGWDDHDRSGRYIGHDIGYNFLVSCPPDAILMNFGDNDSFPPWYNQEVENVRPDVRIMNMSYIAADWYIEQMTHAYNESAPVPFTIPYEVYSQNDMVYVQEITENEHTVKSVVEFVKSDNPQTKATLEDGSRRAFVPTRHLVLPVDKAAAVASGIVKPEDAHLMVDSIHFSLPERGFIDKSQLMLLDLLANFDWKRPLCFTMLQNIRDIGLGDWLQSDGWVYRLVPVETPFNALDPGGRVDTEFAYDLLMNKYRYGNASEPGVFIDHTSIVNLDFVRAHESFARLAMGLVAEGDSIRAVEVLDRALMEYPASKFDYDYFGIYPIIRGYYAAGALDRGDALLEDYANTLQEYIEYYLQFEGRQAEMIAGEFSDRFRDLDSLARLAAQFGRREQYAAIDKYLDMFGEAEEEAEEGAPA